MVPSIPLQKYFLDFYCSFQRHHNPLKESCHLSDMYLNFLRLHYIWFRFWSFVIEKQWHPEDMQATPLLYCVIICQWRTGMLPLNMVPLFQRTVGTLWAASPPPGIWHHDHQWRAGTDHSSGRPAEIRSGSTAPAAWPSTPWPLG